MVVSVRVVITATAIVCCAIASEALASDWRLVGSSPDGQKAYVDASSVRNEGTSRVIWEKFVDTKADGSVTSYSIDHTRYDCAARTYTLLSWSKYRGDGTPADSEQIPPLATQSKDVVPDSVAESILNAACGKNR